MKHIFSLLRSPFFVLLFIHVMILPYVSYAYIDPNTGGFFFSSVLPFVYGILAMIVMFWKRIFYAVKRLFTKKKEDDDK